LYSGTKAELPTDTLANLTSRLDYANAAQQELEVEEAKRRAYWKELEESNPEQFEKESRSLVLQLKGTGPFADIQRKSMQQLKRENPDEYTRRALEALKPRKVTQDVIIYVIQEGKRETWRWPDGRLVKRGEEVTYDTRMKRFCLMPGPAGVELDPVTAPGRQKMELNQHDDGSFHWEPEGSQGKWNQGPDGLWSKVSGSESPWTTPEKIVFRKAEPHIEGSGKDHFRYGQWWSLEDVQNADAADAANPPNLLSPLPRFAVADSLALPPPTTAADRAKDNKEPSVWKRHEQKMREEKEREAQLLRSI